MIQYPTFFIRLSWALAGAAFLTACSNDVEVNAPAKDIVVVYGVLNPQDSVQYIRIAKGYQTKSDALKFAAENDLSLTNATVKLIPETGDPIPLTTIDAMKDPGVFKQPHKVYTTKAKILAGKKYKLSIVLAGQDPATEVTAETTVPDRPYIVTLDSLHDPNVIGITKAYTMANLTSDKFKITFYKSEILDGAKRKPGAAYEAYLGFKYGVKQAAGDTLWRAGDVPEWSAAKYNLYGPLLIAPPNFSNTACNFGDDAICFEIGRNFEYFILDLAQKQPAPVYRNDFLNQSTYLKVTAMDQALYDYIQVNDPAFVDFTTAKPEYTNLKMANPAKTTVAGVFGSSNYAFRYIRLSPCMEYLAGLNGTPKPASACIK